MGQDSCCDKRVIVLGKALTLDSTHYSKLPLPINQNHAGGRNIALGYFDSLDIYPLPEEPGNKNWLGAIWRHSGELSSAIDGNVYYHPIYIMAYGDDKWKVQADKFWKADARYLCVSFAHHPLSSHSEDIEEKTDDELDYFKRMRTAVTSELKKAGENEAPVQTQYYQTMNLSNMVIVWKSNSLTAILKNLRRVYGSKEIGSLHTISSFQFSKIGPMVPEPDEETEDIPYVSVRFATRDRKAAGEFAKALKGKWPGWPIEETFITTGIEDLEVSFRTLSVAKFLGLISLWYGDKEINALFRKAFYDCSTHLGIENDENGELPNISSALTERCMQLLSDWTETKNRLAQRFGLNETQMEFSWARLISVQLNAMIHMSRICVLDGFCYLILDGVQFFCRHIEQILEQEGKPGMRLLSGIHQFVRGWNALMEQAVRIDGQFTPSPGFAPVLYDIPVNLLEFYMAVAKRFMYFLQFGEKDPKQFSMLLLPKLCRRTKVEDIFRTPPPSDRLLCVKIPLDLLYSPKQVLYQLCHEISHYCGETQRSRETRFGYVTQTCAYLIAWYLNLGEQGTVKQIYEDLRSGIKEEDRAYLVNLSYALRQNALSLLSSATSLMKWQDIYLSREGRSQADEKRWIAQSNHTWSLFLRDRMGEFSEDITRITRLFEECYADISFIYYLQPSLHEYLLLYKQEIEWIDTESQAGRTSFIEFVQRVAIVSLVVKAHGGWSEDPPAFGGRLDRFFHAVKAQSRNITEKVPQDGLYFPPEILGAIVKYLSICHENFCKSEQASEGLTDELREFRRVFKSVAEDYRIGGPGFYRILAQYEYGLLGQPAAQSGD